MGTNDAGTGAGVSPAQRAGDLAASPTPTHASGPARAFLRKWHNIFNALATWLLSLVFMLVVPSIPLGIEWAKHQGVIQPENELLTAAVLAASFGVAAEHNFARVGYLALFIGAIIVDYEPAQSAGSLSPAELALKFMVAVAVVHAIERFYWHVALDRKFPDWMKG